MFLQQVFGFLSQRRTHGARRSAEVQKHEGTLQDVWMRKHLRDEEDAVTAPDQTQNP